MESIGVLVMGCSPTESSLKKVLKMENPIRCCFIIAKSILYKINPKVTVVEQVERSEGVRKCSRKCTPPPK